LAGIQGKAEDRKIDSTTIKYNRTIMSKITYPYTVGPA
jgi:hypothetical protein